MKKRVLGKVKRVVLKIGTSLLFSETKGIDPDCLHQMTQQVAALRKKEIEVLLVTSGAIACGTRLLGFQSRPVSLPLAQAAAAVGQAKLMNYYDEDLRRKGLLTSQVLLTQDDFRDRRRYWNARNTLLTLLRVGALPIINENDTVSTEEICFGDNDQLSALVTELVRADLLVILSVTEGLLTADPRHHREVTRIKEVRRITPRIERMAGDGVSEMGSGGMKTKIAAAKRVTRAGKAVVFANGWTPNVLVDLFQGKEVGTFFLSARR